MHEDFELCLRAVQSKDSRFDGWFVTAVLSTGIYCRPSCPVRPPMAKNVRFFPSAAAAQQAGLRACKRCRPDASPGSPEWNVRADVVARAMRLIALSPSALRARARSSVPAAAGALTLRLPLREPFCAENLFGHLAATAVPGVEEVRGGWYRRTLTLSHGHGVVGLRPAPGHILCSLHLDDLRDLTTAVARCRRLLDLDADPVAVDDALRQEPLIAPVVAKAPGHRVPRCVDGEEMAVRVVLGQQVSTAAARTHAARLVSRHGQPVDDPQGGLSHAFPPARDIDPSAMGLPLSRRRCLTALLEALAGGLLDVGAGADWDAARAVLAALPGIGPSTAEMIAMRSLGDPDAFPASDLGVRKAMAHIGAGTVAERWRPWRAYATQYLWSVLDHPIYQWPAEERS